MIAAVQMTLPRLASVDQAAAQKHLDASVEATKQLLQQSQQAGKALQSELELLKAKQASASQSLQQAQHEASAVKSELKLSRANQASAQDSLRQAEQSIDLLQHELDVLQHGVTPPSSPDGRSSQVSTMAYETTTLV